MTFFFDAVALAASTAIFIGYHFYLRSLVRREPSSVLSFFAAQARSKWAETMMRSPDNAVLAVQTLRNSSMAATFLASTAILLMIGILTFSNQAVGTQSPWHLLNLIGAIAPEIWLGKTLCMLIVMFFAFFCFSNSIRIFTHVGYLISARNPDGENEYSTRVVASELNRGGRFFSMGMRAYYFMIPLVCWLFGPSYLLACTIVLVVALLPWVDRVPMVDSR